MKKRIFALALSLIMALSLLPAPAMASNYEILREAVEYLRVHNEEISEQLTNNTDEDGLARIILAELKTVMPEDMDIEVTTTIYNTGDVIRKNATTTERGFLTAQFVLTMGGDPQDWVDSFYIPVAAEDQGEIDGMEADKAAIAAAFADYFATARVDESNILQQKKTLQEIMDHAVRYCTEAKFLNGSGFSTSIKNGYIRATYRLVLGGQTQEVSMDAAIHADGSVTINSIGSAAEETDPEPTSEYNLADLDDPRYRNIGPSEATKKYRNGEQFVLMVCTSDCGWCQQMKKGLPATLSDANYAIYGTNDDLGEISFFWNYTPFNSLGTPILVLVNGTNDVEVVGSVRNQEMMADVLQKAKDRGIPSADGAVQTPPAPAQPAAPATGTAYPSTQTVDLDGRKVEFQMYALKDQSGNSTNYVKVRDLALALNGTKAQFGVGWDGAVNLMTGTAYAPNGSENSTPYSGERSYTVPTSPTNVNGAASDLQAIVLTDDAGGGFTYYQLRDLGRKLGFNVGWSAEKGVFIESDKTYSGK